MVDADTEQEGRTEWGIRASEEGFGGAGVSESDMAGVRTLPNIPMFVSWFSKI